MPPSLAGRLLSEGNLPLTFRLQLFAGPGVPVGAPHYLGWSGSVSQNGKVSISSRLGMLLQIPEGASVMLTPLSAVDVAKNVTLEPASSDDWEVVELNANDIESRLLEQCGVVSVHRSLPIWVQGQMIALKITATDPNQDVVRLVAGTEVSIAPRPRQAASEDPLKDEALRVPILLRVSMLDTVKDEDNSDNEPRVYISASTLEQIQSRSPIEDGSIVGVRSGAKFKTDMLARVCSAKSLPNGHAIFPKSIFTAVLKRYGIQNFQHVEIKPFNIKSFPPLFMEDYLRRSNSASLSQIHVTKDPADEVIKRMPCDMETLQECLKFALPILSDTCRSVLQHWGSPRRGGLLLEGPQGSGKTALVKSLCNVLHREGHVLAATKYIDCRSVVSPKSFFSMLNYSFSWAAKNAPSVIVLDNLDVALSQPAQDEAGHEVPQDPDVTQLVRVLCEGMDVVTKAGDKWKVRGDSSISHCGGWAPIVFIATCKQVSKLPKCLRFIGRFDTVLTLKSPDLNSRLAMLAAGIAERDAVAQSSDLVSIGPEIDGFDGSDIDTLIERIISVSFNRTLAEHWLDENEPNMVNFPLRISRDDLQHAVHGMVPAAMWGSRTKKKIHSGIEGWGDVGGMSHVKEALQESLELPLRYPDLIASAPLRLQTGSLLYGPPGCGKTHIVAAAVAAADIRCIVVNGPELLNKYIGASEAGVRDVFQRAAVAAPCVLFFDEFDAIAPKRGHDNTGVSDRVVNQLLTELDGVEGLKGVAVIGATSRPDLIDAALLRPGRLDKMLYCGFPSTPERKEILLSLVRRLKISDDVDLDEIAEITEDFSGADLGALLSDAQLIAAHEALEEKDTHNHTKDSLCIKNHHVQKSMHDARPSVSQAEKGRLESIYQRFRDGTVEIPSDTMGKKVTYA